MKKGFSFILMILVLLIGFQQAIIVAHFKLNRQFITQNYCVNRDTPAMGCNGLCHLKKQLSKTGQSGSTPMSYPKTYLLIIPLTDYDGSNSVSVISATCFAYKENSYKEPSAEIFIPPPIGRSNAGEYFT